MGRFVDSMKTKSLALGLALVLSGCAFVPFPAQAGPNYRYYENNDCNRGGGYNSRGYVYNQPVRYYRPVQYAPSYYQRPTFQIGFSFGGGNGGYNRGGWNRGGNCR